MFKSFFETERSVKRTLTPLEKQHLYENAKGRCQNPGCKKPKITFFEMQAGHKTAYAKGGPTTAKNSVCLCYGCNKLQGTDSWATFLKKQNVEDPKTVEKRSMKQALGSLTLAQLKSLAVTHHVKVLGRIEEGVFEDHRVAPTKSQYVTKFAAVVTSAELDSLSRETPVRAKPKERRT